jgi:hypothetical protein
VDRNDSILPPEVRDELLGRGRRPFVPPGSTRKAYGWLRELFGYSMLFLVPIGGLVLLISLSERGTQQSQAPVAPVSRPKATAATPATPEHVIEQPILPPRAQLLKLATPPPRATLVALPREPTEISRAHLDESHDIMMPYGTVVRATLRGFLEQENQLPQVGHIGDMYVVGETPWIWIQVPGTTAPTWIDP